MTLALHRLAGAVLVAALTVSGVVAAYPTPAHASTATADTIYYWNDVLLEAFRREGGGPGPLARAAAMMHAGIFDLLNSDFWAEPAPGGRLGYHGYTGIHPGNPGNPPDDEDLEAGRVAATLLVDALPGQAQFVQQAFVERHGNLIPDLDPMTEQVIDAMRELRAGDGADDTTAYPFESTPGAWRFTDQLCNTPDDVVTPNWGRVTPFTMTSTTQFRQGHPGGHGNYGDLLGSDLYAQNFNEVKSLGRFDSTTRTPEQEDVAWFWANDLDGTYKPVGQLLSTLQDVAQEQAIADPVELSRIYTLVSLALADAGIAAWDQKYDTTIDLWRPQTAIQQADTDGNSGTAPDPNWFPLSATAPPLVVRINPCFPAWVSGHATFAAAWAGIMSNELGDTLTVTVGSEDPRAVGVTRTFSGFTEAAVENAESRIYLGVHYRFDADSGLATGFSLADYVYDNFLTVRCTDPSLCPPEGLTL